MFAFAVSNKRLENIEHYFRGNVGAQYYAFGRLVVGFGKYDCIEKGGCIADSAADGSQDPTRIVFLDGKLRNRGLLEQAISEKMDAPPIKFKNADDPTLLLWGYEILDEALTSYLIDDLSIAIYDHRKRKLLLFADYSGRRRLYYSCKNGTMTVSTDLRLMINFPWVSKSIRKASLIDYVYYQYVPAPHSIYSDIWKTVPGILEKLNFGSSISETANHLPSPNVHQKLNINPSDENNLIHKIEYLLNQSIAEHAEGHNKMGVMLSSGIDSSVLAALAAQNIGKEIYSFTIGFSDREKNENSKSGKIAAHLKLRHHDIMLGSDELLSKLSDWLDSMGEPWAQPASLPTYLAFQYAKRNCGIDLMLDGSGADGLFGLKKHPGNDIGRYFFAAMPGFASIIFRNIVEKAPLDHSTKNELVEISHYYRDDIIAHWFGWKGKYFELLMQKPNPFKQTIPGMAFHDPRLKKNRDKQYRAYFAVFGHSASIGRPYLAGQANRINVHFPYEEYNWVNLVKSIPRKVLYRKGDNKYWLKKLAYRKIPKELFNEHLAISTPLSKILDSGAGKNLINHYLSDDAIKKNVYFAASQIKKVRDEFISGNQIHAQRIWCLLTLEMWFDLRKN